MYELSEELMQDKQLTHVSKLVFAVVAEFNKRNPASNLAYATIAQKTNLSEMTVMRSIKQLVEQRWLVVAKNNRGWNYYGVTSETEKSE